MWSIRYDGVNEMTHHQLNPKSLNPFFILLLMKKIFHVRNSQNYDSYCLYVLLFNGLPFCSFRVETLFISPIPNKNHYYILNYSSEFPHICNFY